MDIIRILESGYLSNGCIMIRPLVTFSDDKQHLDIQYDEADELPYFACT